ncbi:cysteine-rich receptor-like protein kinase 15 [Bidens hawaiensis]|uniref:cysteine-rich receptor-like protein kinase 15 n=1 Tax=Bidens hawaiensis TaxID=980011 RepID=UPI004049F5A8
MFIIAGKPPLRSLYFIITYLLNTNTTIILAQPEFINHYCGDFGKYVVGSTYEKNLDTTLSTLPTTNSGAGFYNFSTGLGDDRVNSIALCRGDVNLDVCQSCLNDSIVNLRQLCPNQNEALGYYDYCMLRYSNEVIVGNTEANIYSYSSRGSQSTNVGEFSKALKQLYSNLTVKAAAGDTLLKFATGDTIGPDDTRIYALVQCTPYLKKEQCSNCFNNLTQHSKWLDGKVEGKLFLPMCNIIYDTQQFYNETDEVKLQPPPPPTILHPSLQPPSVLPPSPQPPGKKKKRVQILEITIVTFIVIVVTIITVLCIFMRLRKKKKQTKPTPEIQTEFYHYPFDTVKAATNNFSEENKLGSGGFGVVYKGTLEDGKLIAVKRLTSSNQRDTEFENEVSIMARLQHRNLVKLLGYSIKESERLLVLELLPNGSLDDFLFDATKRVLLDWKTRYNIIKGIAKGLLYLHVDSRSKIIHRDMKAANVLLDENLEPKITDFGTAKLFQTSETHRDTKQPIGTPGYMAPEYYLHGHITVKLDVFSFGMLILEIVTGQRIQKFQTRECQGYLPDYAWKSLKNDQTSNLIDPNMKTETGSLHEIIRSVHIGLLCVQERATDRPTMDLVVQMLNSFSTTLPFPAEPTAFTQDDVDLKTSHLQENDSSTGMWHSSSMGNSNSIMEN